MTMNKQTILYDHAGMGNALSKIKQDHIARPRGLNLISYLTDYINDIIAGTAVQIPARGITSRPIVFDITHFLESPNNQTCAIAAVTRKTPMLIGHLQSPPPLNDVT